MQGLKTFKGIIYNAFNLFEPMFREYIARWILDFLIANS
jgi:hypothetical protein